AHRRGQRGAALPPLPRAEGGPAGPAAGGARRPARAAGGGAEGAGRLPRGGAACVAGRLEADGVLHRQPVARRPATVRRRWRLGTAGAAPARRAARPVPAGLPGPSISLVLVGRRAGRPVGALRMHPELPRPVAGPAEVSPVVELHEVSKWYGHVIAVNRLTPP